MSRAEHQPDAAVLAVADDLLDRLGGDATTRFNPRGDIRLQVVEEDAVELAHALGALAPHEPGEPLPSYRRVVFDLDRMMPAPGAYLVVADAETGATDICCVLALAGHDVDLDVPGAPLLPGHALLAVWSAEDLNSDAPGISDADDRARDASIDHDPIN